MRRSSASLALALLCSFAAAAPACGGTVGDDPAVDGGAGSGNGPAVVKGGSPGVGGGPRGGSGSSSKGGSPGTAGTSSKGGSSGKGGKGGKGASGGAAGDLFELDVPPEAEVCYSCAKKECKDQISECNQDPQCVAVAGCLLDKCSLDQTIACATSCLEENGLSLSDFQNPTVQAALAIGQCVQKECPDDCQAPGAGGSGGTQGGGGKGQGGKSGSGGGLACSQLACAQSCGTQGFACSQDKVCSACAQDPKLPGCDTLPAFQDAKKCCNDNVAVCGGCQGCSAVIESGTGGASGAASAGASGAGGGDAAGSGGVGTGGAAGGAAGESSGGAAGESSGGAAGESSGGAAGEASGGGSGESGGGAGGGDGGSGG